MITQLSAGAHQHAHRNLLSRSQNRLHECKRSVSQLRAERTFWLAYAEKNDIHSDGDRAVAAARAHAHWMGQDAIVVWPNGREQTFLA